MVRTFNGHYGFLSACCLSAGWRSGLVTSGKPANFLAMCIFILARRSEEHTSELQSLMRISYAVFCLKKKKQKKSRQGREQKTERKKGTNERKKKIRYRR